MANIQPDNDGRHTDSRHTSERDPETRHRILKVSEQLFVEKGFKGVSMKDIAEEVQVTAAALYYYFPQGKQELFVSMFLQAIEDWGREIFKRVSETAGLHEKLLIITEQTLIQGHVYFAEMGRDLREYCQDVKRKREQIHATQQRLFEGMNTIFQEAIDAGEIRAETPVPILSIMFMGMVMGLQSTQRFMPEVTEHTGRHELALLIVNNFLNGVGTGKK